MRKTVFTGCAIVTLTSILCLLFLLSRSNNANKHDLGFPFELKENRSSSPPAWYAYVLLEPKHYSKQNLDRLFLWYAKKHPNKDEEISIAVYTDPEQLRLYRENADDGATNYGDRPRKSKYRSPPWDAFCWRGGDGLSGGGHNLLYTYMPDLNIVDLRKRIVLRGRDYNSDKKITETFEVTRSTLKINVIAYDYLITEPSSKYYTFSSLHGGKGDFKAVFSIRLDVPVSIPREQVRIVDDKVALVFMGWMYAVTIDGGKSWDVWDAETDLLNWECCDPNLIRDVNISDQGNGVMTLRPDPRSQETLVYLHTDDFGRHWKRSN